MGQKKFSFIRFLSFFLIVAFFVGLLSSCVTVEKTTINEGDTEIVENADAKETVEENDDDDDDDDDDDEE